MCFVFGCVCALHLFIRNTLADVLHVCADILHVGKTQQDFSKVFLANSGHSFGIGQKLNFQHLSLEVIHKPEKWRGTENEEDENRRLPCGQHRQVPVEVIKGELCFSLLSKEMDQYRGINCDAVI